MRRRIALAVVTLMVAPALVAWAAAQTSTERLVAGEQKVVKPGYAVGDIAIANPGVCDFRVVSGRREVMLIANGPGFTTLTIWDQRSVKRDEIAIEVVSREFAKLEADLLELLRPYPGVAVKPLGNRIVLTGTVSSADELEKVNMVASVVGALVMVTAPAADADTAPVAVPVQTPAQVAVPTQTPPPADPPPPLPRVIPDPTPPPPVRRPVGETPPAVALPPGTVATPTTVPTAPPAVATVPEVALPPPPALPAAAPAAVPAPSEPAVDYLIEVFESPSNAPPPEVSGPQGKRLFVGQLTAVAGHEVRQLIDVPMPGTNSSQMRSLSIGVTPTIGADLIQTAVVVDTNLPIGSYDQTKDPVWLRCTVNFTGRSAQTRFLYESELARTAEPAFAPPSVGGEPGTGAKAADAAVAAGQAAAARHIPGASNVPSVGAIVSTGGDTRPKARPTVLLIAITPTLARRGP